MSAALGWTSGFHPAGTRAIRNCFLPLPGTYAGPAVVLTYKP